MSSKEELAVLLRRRKDIPQSFITRYIHMLNWINEPEGSTFIDVGCNTGIFDAHLARLGYLVQGVDLSEQAIRVANNVKKDWMPLVGNRLFFRCEDASKLSDKTNTYDSGIITEVLEHIPNYIEVIYQMKRVVKPHKRIYCSVPRDHEAYDPSHVNFFTQEKIEEIIGTFGCKVWWNNHPELPFHLIFSFINIK